MVKAVTNNLEGPYNETEDNDLSMVNVSFKVIAIREAHLKKHMQYGNTRKPYFQGNHTNSYRSLGQGHGPQQFKGCSRGRPNYQNRNGRYQYQYYTHDPQSEQYGPPCSLCGRFNHSPKHCYKGEHDINNIMEKMSINLHQSQQNSNGDHDNPHEPLQKELEGCDISQNTLYSHQTNPPKESDDFGKLLYIYQHFQDSEKMHQIEPESKQIASDDDSLYPYVNNDIEYGLFKDIVDSY